MFSRFLAFLLAALLAASALSGCGGAEERKADYLSRGKKYFEEQNFDKAKVEFRNVLQIDPKTPKPYFYLGQIEESKQNWREAFGLYLKAAELDPDDVDVKLKLAKFYMFAKDQEKAAELVTTILQARPGDIEGRILKSAIDNAKGDSDSAIKELESVIVDQPSRTDAYLVLAILFEQKKDKLAAERVLTQGLSKNEGNPTLLLGLAKLEGSLNKLDKVEELLKKLISADPKTLDHRALLANLYIQTKRPNEAEEVLRTAIQAEPKDPRRYALLEEFLIKNGKRDQAIEEIGKAVKAYPEEAALRFAQAQLFEQFNQVDKAIEVYKEIVDKVDSKPDVLKAKNRLALLAMARNQEDEASKLIGEILKESPQDAQALLLQGRIALSKKDAQQAISSFRSILKDQPDSVEVLTLLAAAHQLDGKPALAQESLEKAAAAKPDDFNATKRLVEFFLQQKNNDSAMERTEQFLKANPKSLDGFNLKADLLALRKDQPEALEKVLQQIKAEFPDKVVGPFRLGQFYQTQKKHEAAIAEFEAALKITDNDYEPLKGIVGSYLELQQPEKALARLKKVLAEKPKHPNIHQLLAMYYLSRKQDEEAIKSLNLAIEANPRWPVPRTMLANIYSQKGKYDQAIKTFEEALKVFPDNLELQLSLAHLHESAADFPGAIKLYEAILAKYPDNLAATNNLASLLSLDGKDKPALEKATELAKKLEKGSDPSIMDTVGWIHYQNGKYEDAVSTLQRAVEKAEKEPIFQYHLGMALLKKGDNDAAKDHLQKAVDLGKTFIGMQEAKEALKNL